MFAEYSDLSETVLLDDKLSKVLVDAKITADKERPATAA